MCSLADRLFVPGDTRRNKESLSDLLLRHKHGVMSLRHMGGNAISKYRDGEWSAVRSPSCFCCWYESCVRASVRVIEGRGQMISRSVFRAAFRSNRGAIRANRRNHGRTMVFALVVSCLGLFGTSLVATASTTARRKQSPVQKGLAFYKGKTILVIDSGTVGGAYDLYARVIMPYIAQYLHASYEVEDVSEADGLPGQDQAASAPPTGLTAGVFQLFSSISKQIAGAQGLNFNVERLAWIAGDGLSTNVLAASSSSGISNISQLIADSKSGAASNKPVKMIISTTGSLASALPRALFGLLGINVEYLTGYSNVGAEASGLVRGDGQVTFIASSTLGPLIAGGQAKAIAITGKIPISTKYRSVEDVAPTFAQILKEYPPKTKANKILALALDDITSLPSGLLALQTGVAGYKIDAMRAAAAWAEKQPNFRSQMLADSLNPIVYNPVAAKSAFISSLKKEKGLGCYLAASCS